MEKCKNFSISKNLTKTYDVPVNSPIFGNQGIREDIGAKGGYIEASAVGVNSFPEAGMLYSDVFTGAYIVISQAKIKEGGETPNPNEMFTTTINGVM